MYSAAMSLGSRTTSSLSSLSLKPGHLRLSTLPTKLRYVPTCPEVDNNITEENGVRDHIEDDPAGGQVIVEEGDGDREDDEVSYEQQQHADVPVESWEIKLVIADTAAATGILSMDG